MDEQTYKDQITRLREVYGPRNYPDKRVQSMWPQLKHFENYLFVETCTDLINNRKTAPLLNDFVQELHRRKRRDTQKVQQARENFTPFVPTPEWIEQTNRKLLAEDPNFNAEGASRYMNCVVKALKSRYQGSSGKN